MNGQQTIRLTAGVTRNPLVRLVAPASVAFGADEHIAIVGPNGAGKSLLVGMLTGEYPLREGRLEYDFRPSASTSAYGNIRYVAFRDTYGGADANYYYQQRWNAHDQDEVPTVRDLLGRVENEEQCRALFSLFGLESLLDKKIILLSSGELRKFQLAKALLGAPRVLVVDNPFIGLDAEARRMLCDLMGRVAATGSIQLVAVLSSLDDVPPFVTHVVPVDALRVFPKMARADYLETFRRHDETCRSGELRRLEALRERVAELSCTHEAFPSDEVVSLRHVSIRYGDRIILRDLDWTVTRGEKWALSGENGAGKSTLLSLIYADNPQSYACDISLFGRKRGSGESIWEIKKHIGYVSPEMHRAYLKNLPAVDIVASGLHDSIGLYKRPRPEEAEVCGCWMDVFGIGALRDKPFLQLSSGEQRLVLLARAFVKDPELLILDEPLHGLDTYNRRRVKAVIEAFCRRPDKTLIMVTHYEDELPAVINRRLRLKRAGTPEEK